VRREVGGAYVLKGGGRVGFAVGEYDAARPLIIDPTVLTYSTYLGGGDRDTGRAIALDSAGNAYVTGSTSSTNFPTANPLQPAKAGVSFHFIPAFRGGPATVWARIFPAQVTRRHEIV